MSDTVPSATLLSSLVQAGPSFIASEAPTVAGTLHVSGGVHADPDTVALIIDFHPPLPGPPPAISDYQQPRPTLPGYASLLPQDPPTVVEGALHHT